MGPIFWGTLTYQSLKHQTLHLSEVSPLLHVGISPVHQVKPTWSSPPPWCFTQPSAGRSLRIGGLRASQVELRVPMNDILNMCPATSWRKWILCKQRKHVYIYSINLYIYVCINANIKIYIYMWVYYNIRTLHLFVQYEKSCFVVSTVDGSENRRLRQLTTGARWISEPSLIFQLSGWSILVKSSQGLDNVKIRVMNYLYLKHPSLNWTHPITYNIYIYYTHPR